MLRVIGAAELSVRGSRCLRTYLGYHNYGLVRAELPRGQATSAHIGLAEARPSIWVIRIDSKPALDALKCGLKLRTAHERAYFRVRTARFRSGNKVRQTSQTVPSQPRAVQCSRP